MSYQINEILQGIGAGFKLYRESMKDWEAFFERLVWSFGEREFKRFFKGFLADSRELASQIDTLDLQLISEYVPDVFWRRLKKNITLYAVDALLRYFFGPDPDKSSVEEAENLLILNSLFWERFIKKGHRKAGRIRPREEYYLSMGAFFYRLSYMNKGATIYKLMEIHYRPLVKELRKLKPQK